MDPISALSIAAAVVKFVHFGIRLLSDTADNYRSSLGESRDRLDLEAITQELAALSQEVQSKSRLAANSAEEVFLRLCATCADIGKELQECIAIVNAQSKPGRVFRSFLLALQMGRPEDKIKALRTRLGQVEQQMMVAALVFLW